MLSRLAGEEHNAHDHAHSLGQQLLRFVLGHCPVENVKNMIFLCSDLFHNGKNGLTNITIPMYLRKKNKDNSSVMDICDEMP